MHSITLDIAASILLLSGVLSIGLVLKRTPTSLLKSPNSILSISDVSSSVLTAVLVLLHQFYIDTDHNADHRIDQLNDASYFYETFDKSRNNHDGNSSSNSNVAVEEECDYRSVLLQYATFLVPFATAFISLISFSMSFYANAMAMNCRCAELSNCQEDFEKSTETSEQDTKAFEGTSDSRKSEIDDESIRPDIRKSKFFNGSYTNLGIIGQWLIPALFTSVFQFGQYQRINVSSDAQQELICAIAANFPFENCIENIDSTSGILSAHSVASYSSINDYASSEDNLLGPHPNSTEVSHVLSNIYKIVQSATSDSTILNATLPVGHYNITQLLDIMSHKQIQHLTTIDQLIETDNRKDSKEIPLRNVGLTGATKTLISKKPKSHVMHSFANKVSNDHEQPELNNTLIMQCLRNRCMISTTFLKIYLFILLTLVYFAPIFVSALILVKSYHECRAVTEKLKESKSKLGSQIQHCEVARERTATDTNTRQQSNALKLGWFSEYAKEDIGQEVAEETDRSRSTATRAALEKITCELRNETDKMRSLFKIFKVNALLAVALWTPFFLQILSKVFLCSNVPNWLMETTFLATIVFSIFKNAVNVNFIKIDADANNVIHPSAFNLL